MSILVSCCHLCFSAPRPEFWVSPTGNDNNPGTAAKPLASIARAQQRARELRQSGNTNPAGPIEIILRSGVYPLSAPLRLRSADIPVRSKMTDQHAQFPSHAGTTSPSPLRSGDLSRLGSGERNVGEATGPRGPSERERASQQGRGEEALRAHGAQSLDPRPSTLNPSSYGLIITAAPGETPVISGGIQITHWKPAGHINGLPKVASGNAWVANVPKINGRTLEFRQLWVNGSKAVRAREPNDPNLARLVAWDKTNQVATIPAASLAAIIQNEPPNRSAAVWGRGGTSRSNVNNRYGKFSSDAGTTSPSPIGWERAGVRAEAHGEKSLAPPPSTPAPSLEMIIDQVWEIAVLRVNSIELRGTNALIRFKEPESGIEFRHPWPPVIVKTNYQAPFFFANAIEFLDSPGEWFEDLHAGKIYYWPRAGEDMVHAKCFAPVLETLVEIEGTSNEPVVNVEFKGITFAHTTWLRPSEQGHVPLQAGMFLLDAKKLSPKGTPYHRGLDNLAWIGRPPAAVSVKNARHIDFENCAFEHLASAGLDFQSGTHDDLVQGCLFRDIGGNGIQLGKFSDTNVETHMPYNPSDEHEICKDERIEDNLITDCANEDWGGVGIGVGYARGIRIEHNDVFNCSYTGISVGWGWTKMTNALRDNFIHANHVHRVATRLNDTAGIYTLSAQPGTVISENSIEDIQPSPYVPDPQHWYYLYLDEGSSFITVRDNWCPAEKFLKNANGPGNVWENNGPQVSEKIRAAAGLEPAFRNLLRETNLP